MGFWNSVKRKARKDYRCTYCNKIIKKGEEYSRESGIFERQFNDYCLCLRCLWLIETFEKDGEYLADIWETLFENDLMWGMLKMRKGGKQGGVKMDYSVKPLRASWDERGKVVLEIAITLREEVISSETVKGFCNNINYFLLSNIDRNTVDIVSQWLSENGFERASMAIDAEFEL